MKTIIFAGKEYNQTLGLTDYLVDRAVLMEAERKQDHNIMSDSFCVLACRLMHSGMEYAERSRDEIMDATSNVS